MGERRATTVAGTAGLVVLVVALLVAAVRWGTPQDGDPLTAASSSSATPTRAVVPPTAPRTSAPPTKRQQRHGAIARVPRAVILRQLARAAERIAQHMPMPTTPADVDPRSNRGLGYHLMIEFGFAADQWKYLDALWTRESGWNNLAENKSSGAYGIPQSLPGSKMAVVGPDWRTNPETQIKWGLAYIAARYGTPQGAWAHSQRTGWY